MRCSGFGRARAACEQADQLSISRGEVVDLFQRYPGPSQSIVGRRRLVLLPTSTSSPPRSGHLHIAMSRKGLPSRRVLLHMV